MSSLPNSDDKRNRTLMTLDYVYKTQGGSAQMLSMVEQAATLQTIANHFGITRERVSQMLRVILGMPYSKYLASKNIHRSGVAKNEA